MGFYLRKSISLGPFRFNLSKSGIGLSTGIRGFRVGTGPRGNYVHVGRHGLYYRASLDGPSSGAPSGSVTGQPAVSDGLPEIESGSVLQMVDSSAAGLLEELNAKKKLARRWWWPLLAAVLALVMVPESAPEIRVGISAVAVLASVWLNMRDQLRKTTVLFYDLEEPIEQAFERLHDAIQQLALAGRVWHIEAEGATTDPKRNAGASHSVRRKVTSVSTSGTPPGVATNIAIPAIGVGRQTLHFFPDRLLVFDRDAVGAVPYRLLTVEASRTRFIESESVPSDAKVVDKTWRYVNKMGGPDRRFSNNRELPICEYLQITFKSSTGLQEVLQVSRIDAGDVLRSALRTMVSVSENTSGDTVQHD